VSDRASFGHTLPLRSLAIGFDALFCEPLSLANVENKSLANQYTDRRLDKPLSGVIQVLMNNLYSTEMECLDGTMVRREFHQSDLLCPKCIADAFQVSNGSPALRAIMMIKQHQPGASLEFIAGGNIAQERESFSHPSIRLENHNLPTPDDIAGFGEDCIGVTRHRKRYGKGDK